MSALPIDDRVFERILPGNVGRPDLMAGRTSLTLAEGMTRMTENIVLNTSQGGPHAALTSGVFHNRSTTPRGPSNGLETLHA